MRWEETRSLERFLDGLAAFVERRPRPVLLGIALLTVLLGAQLPRVQISYDPLAFLPADPQVELFRHVEEEFGVGSFSHLLVVRFAPKPGYSIDGPQAVVEMEAVLQALRGVPGVTEVQGIPDFVKFVRGELHGGDPAFATLPVEGDELGYSFEEIIRLAFQRMALLKKFVSPQGTALATAAISPEADLIAVARRAAEALAPIQQSAEALRIEAASYGGTLDVFNAVTRSDLRRVTPVVTALIVLVLVWIFRLTRPRELGAALALVGVVAALTLVPLGWAPLNAKPWMVVWESAGTVLLLLLVAFTFRSLANLYLPLVVVAIAGIWTFGALGLLGIPFSFLMVAVVPLLLGVGIDDTLHLLHRHEEERCRGHTGPEAVGIALRRTGRALLLTTLTTTAGFAALLLAPSPPLRSFGLLAALAMLSAFTVTVLLVPAIKALAREGPRAEPWPPRGSLHPLVQAMGHPSESWVSRWLRGYARSTGRRGVAVTLLLVGLGLGVAGYWEGHAFQTYSVDYRRMLPREHPIARLYTEVNQEFRPYDEVQIVLTGDLARLDVMRILLKDLPEALSGSPYAHKVTSIAQVLEDVRAANAELGRGFLERFLEDPDGAYSWLFAQTFDREALRARAAPYAGLTPDGRLEAVVRVNTLRFSDQAGVARVTRDLNEHLQPVLAQLEALGVSSQVTGTPYLEGIGLKALRLSFVQSLLLSLVFCFVVLALAFRSLAWAALALGPVVLVTGLVLGSLNLLRLELNAATAVVAALSIGLGIDYAIHLINRFREERDLEVATARTGEALSAAFVTTSSAFFALMLGQITWNRDFGLLVGLAIVYAFGATIFFLTALLRLAVPRVPEAQPVPVQASEPEPERAAALMTDPDLMQAPNLENERS
jgi:predicted RND superfamily exporter protein